MRIHVEINVRQPLVRGVMLCLKSTSMPIQVKYERLPYFCFICGKLGHTYKYCQLPVPQDDSFPYDRFMVASPTPHISKRMSGAKDGLLRRQAVKV